MHLQGAAFVPPHPNAEFLASYGTLDNYHSRVPRAICIASLPAEWFISRERNPMEFIQSFVALASFAALCVAAYYIGLATRAVIKCEEHLRLLLWQSTKLERERAEAKESSYQAGGG